MTQDEKNLAFDANGNLLPISCIVTFTVRVGDCLAATTFLVCQKLQVPVLLGWVSVVTETSGMESLEPRHQTLAPRGLALANAIAELATEMPLKVVIANLKESPVNLKKNTVVWYAVEVPE